MREMGFMRAAEPLVNASTDDVVSGRGDSAEGFEVAYGWGSQEGTATWESRSIFGCVCDSSWEVRAAATPRTNWGRREKLSSIFHRLFLRPVAFGTFFSFDSTR